MALVVVVTVVAVIARAGGCAALTSTVAGRGFCAHAVARYRCPMVVVMVVVATFCCGMPPAAYAFGGDRARSMVVRAATLSMLAVAVAPGVAHGSMAVVTGSLKRGRMHVVFVRLMVWVGRRRGNAVTRRGGMIVRMGNLRSIGIHGCLRHR